MAGFNSHLVTFLQGSFRHLFNFSHRCHTLFKLVSFQDGSKSYRVDPSLDEANTLPGELFIRFDLQRCILKLAC